jgi:type VI secretion system protein ImpG
VRAASLSLPPFQAPPVEGTARATALLRLTLGCRQRTLKFAALSLDRLRFFLKGQAQHIYRLYELLFNNTIKVAVATAANDPKPTVLSTSHIRPVGFERDEGMLPYTKRSFLGYRLLSEYFAFPEKFLFMDITGLNCPALQRAGKHLREAPFFPGARGLLWRDYNFEILIPPCQASGLDKGRGPPNGTRNQAHERDARPSPGTDELRCGRALFRPGRALADGLNLPTNEL